MSIHPAFDLDWNLVRTFVAVVRGGSLAEAAREMGLAHPTVARHVQQLEEAVGLVLFDRTAQGMVLNVDGEHLAEAAQLMQRSALEFESVTESVRKKPVSVVRITVAEMLGEALPTILGEGLADDGYRVELNVTNKRLNLLQRDADFAIRHAAPQQQDLVARRVGAITMGAYASDDYLQRYGALTPATVPDHRFIDGLQEHYFQSTLAQRGLGYAAEQIVFKSDSIASWRSAMQAGLGVAGLPRHMMALPAHNEGVQELLWDTEPFTLDLWLIARPEVRNNRSLYELFENLGEALVGFCDRSVPA